MELQHLRLEAAKLGKHAIVFQNDYRLCNDVDAGGQLCLGKCVLVRYATQLPYKLGASSTRGQCLERDTHS